MRPENTTSADDKTSNAAKALNAGMVRLKTIRANKAGSVLPIAAVGMVTLAALVGGGLDISRGYMVQNRLQNACDAGVLAGRRAVADNGLDTAAKAEATRFFQTNFDETDVGVTSTSFVTSSTDTGKTVDGTAATTLDTVVMQVFGFDTVDLNATCSASLSVGNSDVMMVIDTTGSMDWTISGYTTSNDSQRRVTFLRAAMKNFYDTVSAATTGTSARVRYGFVPYSQSVNVGRLLDPSYLVDTWDIQSRQPEFRTYEEEVLIGYEAPVYTTDSGTTDTDSGDWDRLNNNRFRRESDCENSLPNDTGWTNDGGSDTDTETFINSAGQRITRTRVGQDQTQTIYACGRSGNRYRPYEREQERTIYQDDLATEDPIYETVSTTEFYDWFYTKRTFDLSSYKLFNTIQVNNGTEGAMVSYTWDGCIEERSTQSDSSFSYSSLTGMSPDVNDLDIDSVPTSNDATKWAPLFGDMSYRRGTSSSIYSSDTGYDGHETSARCPVQAQLLAEMSETAFDNYADSLDPQGSTYHDLGMIWGGRLSSPTGIFSTNVNVAAPNGGGVARHMIFLTDGYMQPSSTVHSAYGTEYYDKRITDNGSSNITSRHTSRFLAMCEAVKAKGIRIWVIAFASELTTDLETCASTNSAFDADSSASLNQAFQDIANDVGELRVTQ